MMTEAERLGVRSIAIPPICAGILGYSPSVVAKVLTEEVANYIATNVNSSITDVRFVVLKSDKIILQVSDIMLVVSTVPLAVIDWKNCCQKSMLIKEPCLSVCYSITLKRKGRDPKTNLYSESGPHPIGWSK